MVNKLSNRFRFVGRRLTHSQPTLVISDTKKRVTRHSVKLTNRTTLALSVRRFKTAKNRRSKQYRQLVIPVYGLAIKELAFRRHKINSPKSSKTHMDILFPRMAGAYMAILFGLLGTFYFGLQTQSTKNLELPSSYVPIQENYRPKTTVMSRSEPLEIRIPAINLDTSIVNLGLKADGTMETPNILDYVTGWYKYSPTPGELGPAIITGHVDTYKGISVFWRLRELKPGDTIEIKRADGSIAKFEVLALQQFDQAAFPTQTVYGNLDYAGLRLITCGGTFNRQTGHYNANTVVFAKLIDDPQTNTSENISKILVPLLDPTVEAQVIIKPN